MRLDQLQADDRGVSIIVGAILMFAIAITLLGVLQVTAVPLSVEETEFDHSQTVSSQYMDLRTAALTAALDGETRSTEVTLGTRYPNRFLLLNPPPASGTLRTTTPQAISSTGISGFSLEDDVCGLTSSSLQTRSLVYEANYNQYRTGPKQVFEHGASFREVDGSALVDGHQRLVDGNTITLLPLMDDAYESGINKRSLDIASNGMRVTEPKEMTSQFSITVPSELDAQAWSTQGGLLRDELDPTGKVEKVEDSGDRIRITFKPGTYVFRCAALGIGSPPPALPPGQGSGGGSGGGNPINPTADQGRLVLLNERRGNQDGEVIMEFENPHSTETIVTNARINFFNPVNPGNAAGQPQAPFGGKFEDPKTSSMMEVGGDFVSANDITFSATDTDTITIRFYSDQAGTDPWEPANTETFYVLTLRFSDGSTGTYFLEFESGLSRLTPTPTPTSGNPTPTCTPQPQCGVGN